MTVPRFILQNIEKRLEREGLRAQMGEVHFDPSGTIMIKNIRMYSSVDDEPILKCKMALIDLNVAKLFFREIHADRIEASGVELFSPPQRTLSGIREKILSNTHFSLEHKNDRWIIKKFITQLGALKAKIHGAIRTYSPKIESEDMSFSHYLGQFIQLSPELMKIREHFSYFKDPILTIKVKPWGVHSFIADFAFTSNSYQKPTLPEISAIHFYGTGNFQLPLKGNLHISGSVGFIQKDGTEISGLKMAGQWKSLPNKENPWPDNLQWSTTKISSHRTTVHSPYGNLVATKQSKIFNQLSFLFGNQPIGATASLDLENKSGTLSFEGQAGKNWLELASKTINQDLAQYADLTTKPNFTARVDLQSDWKWSRVDFSLKSGPIIAKGVPLENGYVTGTVTPERFDVNTLELKNNKTFISGSYFNLFSTKDYRFLFRGNFHPLTLSPWFKDWWEQFWQNFSFSPQGANCDISIQARRKNPSYTLITGITDSYDLSIKGVSFDRLRSKFLIRSNYIDLYDITAFRPEGKLTGNFQLQYEKGKKIPVLQTFDIDSTTDLKQIAQLFGKAGVKMLSPYGYNIPPKVQLEGSVRQKDARYDSSFDLLIDTPHSFTFNNFPLTRLTTPVFIRNKEVDLPNIHAGFAGGDLIGKAHVQDKDLNFQLTLKEANFEESVDLISKYFATKETTDTNHKILFPESELGGKLDLSLAAKGLRGDPLSFTGNGRIDITEAELGKVHVFGLLSEILQSVMLKFSTLQFTEAHSDFNLNKDHLFFPDIRMKGPLASINSQGTYSMAARTLDFRARVFPFRQSKTPIYALVGVITNPFSYVLEVKLTGTFSDPKWRMLVIPGAFEKTNTQSPDTTETNSAVIPNEKELSSP